MRRDGRRLRVEVLVRDTKDHEGPVLAFRPGTWRQFTGQVKADILHS